LNLSLTSIFIHSAHS